MFRYVAIILTALTWGCDDPAHESTRVCSAYSSMRYDIEPDPRELSISIRLCDDGISELQVSLAGRDSENGWVLVKEPIPRSLADESTKLSDLGITVSKSDFREYTITLPAFINVKRYMKLEERDGLHCQNMKDVTLCFGT